jgi:hypothetical protein
VDRILRPDAAPSPAPAVGASAHGGDALPVLVAAGLLVGGAAVALPALDLAGAGALGARALGGVAGGGRYVRDAVVDFATAYRTGAARLKSVELRDPHAVGKSLGEQAWTSTEEGLRSGVTGAIFGGSAWAAGQLCALAMHAFASRTGHADRR